MSISFTISFLEGIREEFASQNGVHWKEIWFFDKTFCVYGVVDGLVTAKKLRILFFHFSGGAHCSNSAFFFVSRAQESVTINLAIFVTRFFSQESKSGSTIDRPNQDTTNEAIDSLIVVSSCMWRTMRIWSSLLRRDYYENAISSTLTTHVAGVSAVGVNQWSLISYATHQIVQRRCLLFPWVTSPVGYWHTLAQLVQLDKLFSFDC